MKKPYELLSLLCEPVLPYYISKNRANLRKIIKMIKKKPIKILDVGGRLSPFTVGLDAIVDVLDVERETKKQKKLKLGFSSKVIQKLKKRRSNINRFYIQNFLDNTLADKTYDVIIATEVLEHIKAENRFVDQVHRLLKPGGIFYLTVPNRITRPIPDLDHFRHYTCQEIQMCIRKNFNIISMNYYDIITTYRWIGMHKLYATNLKDKCSGVWANLKNRRINAHTPTLPNNTSGLYTIAQKRRN